MRARNLKPQFFTDAELLECQPLARLLFAGLWCLADKDGRLKDQPKQIKIRVLPCDECDPEALLSELAAHLLITRYEVEGRRYIEIRSFKKHQRPHPKEKSMDYPGPPREAPEINGQPRKGLASREPDVSGPEDMVPSKTQAKTRRPSRRSLNATQTFRFGEFWKTYPRKEAKGAAEKAWSKLNPDLGTFSLIMAGLERHLTCVQWHKADDEGNVGAFIPHPATWLNQKRWNDEPQQLEQGPVANLGKAGQGAAKAGEEALKILAGGQAAAGGGR